MHFKNRFITDYLNIIVLDFQINQCNFSINLIASLLLTKVTSQLKLKNLNYSYQI